MQEKQLYLFPRRGNKKEPKSRYSLILPLDTLILLSTVVLLLIAVAFSLGVGKGERTAYNAQKKKIDANTGTRNLSTTLNNTVSSPPAKKNDVNDYKNNTPKEEYLIQVATYRKKQTAYKEAKRLKDRGYPVIVSKKGPYMVIYVGKYKNKNTAKDNMKALKSRYTDCLFRIVKK